MRSGVRQSNRERPGKDLIYARFDAKGRCEKRSKCIFPENDYFVGHSNGGDMVMLFGQEHPGMAGKIISLDNRRMPMPRTQQPQIFSLRSSDQPADPGVLPTPEEQEKYNIHIIPLKNTIHNDMADNGTETQKQEINGYIMQFLGIAAK